MTALNDKRRSWIVKLWDSNPRAARITLIAILIFVSSASYYLFCIEGVNHSEERYRINLVPLVSTIETLNVVGIPALLVVAANFVLLTPVALILALTIRSAPRLLLASVVLFCTSLTIEILQSVLNTGRVSDIDDLIFNTAGGILIYFALTKFIYKPSQH